MLIILCVIFGLVLGSFVNALVYRIHEQEHPISRKTKKSKNKSVSSKVSKRDLSIVHGRSMCPQCHHTLTASDLVPVLSWIELRSKCRYCKSKISWQYPAVELLTAFMFGSSFVLWPGSWNAEGIVGYTLWCVIVTGFMALLVYDVRWLQLPNRITYPLAGVAFVGAVLNVTVFGGGIAGLRNTALSVIISAGIFYCLYQYSKGKWIGGGDIKLGLVIGLVVADPFKAFLVLFLASLLGVIVILPSLVRKKVTATSQIPFGPFLIVATIIVTLFGASIITWYRHKLLLY